MARSSFGHVRKRPDTGRWQARWQDATGRQHSGTFATKAEASAWLRDEGADRAEGTWVDPRAGRLTFEAWQKRWRSTLVGLRPSTLDRDLGYIDRYLVPTFGPAELGQIDRMAVQTWVAKMAGQYAPATTVHAANLLRKCLRAAVENRLIGSNPAEGVKLPRIEQTEMRFLTPEEIWRLHDAMVERYRGVVLLGAYGGLRAGELWALKVGSVNPLRGLVEVTENAVEVNGRVMLGPTKTKAGRRRVPVPRFVIDALRLDGRPSTDLVFPAPRGGYVRRSTFRPRVWVPALEGAGLEGLRFHDLRHTAVALWIDARASVLEIARRAGHMSPSVVLQRYGHLMPWAEDRVTAALEELGRPNGTPVFPLRLDHSGVGDGLPEDGAGPLKVEKTS